MRSQEPLEPDEDLNARTDRRWLADAFGGARACAWYWDAASGRIESAPDPATLFEGAPSTLQALEELVHEADRAFRRSVLSRALERGDSWLCTFRLARVPGVRWIEERGRVWLGADGQPVRAAALTLDVTARKQAEQSLETQLRSESRERHAAEVAVGMAEAALRALSRSEAFLESIFTSMEDGLVLYRPDGGISRMNPRARQMLGYGEAEQDEPIHVRLARIRTLDVEGKPIAFERLPMVAALRGESSRGVPLALRFADGRNVWATAGAAPIRASDGTIVGAVLTLSDVTRLRELQEQREDLARTISHDLRTPLGVILAQAQLLGRRNEGADSVRKRSEAIVANAQRMAAMLNDLVESALLEAGKLRLELAPLDVVSMVRALSARLPAPFGGERIRLEAAEGLPAALADSNRLERVLVNLLTNALKYSAPASEVLVRVGADGGHVVLEIEDRGQGIAPEDLPHLFERYFRALGSSRLEGMGLGLYTARMLVEAHGGTIGVTSVPGQGSVFRVRLPVGSPRA